MELINSLRQSSLEGMKKAIDAFTKDLSVLRTGRANPAILDRITVDYYGASTKLNALGSISVPTPKQITLSIYDNSIVKEAERAIAGANLGVSIVVKGTVIEMNVPEVTEELRKNLVKQAQSFAEKYKVTLRNIRRDFLKELEMAKKDGRIAEDDYKLLEKQFEQDVKSKIDEIDVILKTKSSDILKV